MVIFFGLGEVECIYVFLLQLFLSEYFNDSSDVGISKYLWTTPVCMLCVVCVLSFFVGMQA